MEFEIEICDKCTKTDFNNYMLPNIPCIIENISDNWEAHSKWLTNQNKPNLPYLKNKYGSCDVTIYDCNERYFNSQQTKTCKFATYVDTHWGVDGSKYLKDWHLKNTFKNDNFYEVPIYFASDWLNEFLIENSDDDYRFVYMGQSGTWTPFHADVFSSFSWSANVCGRKKWILLPPGEENLLRDPLGNLPYDISEVYRESEHFELIQNSGEAIFVPSGWHHQVWNLEDTISINHNWVNGCNIEKMWLAIEENLKRVKKEIDDCRDMDDFSRHCQIVLNASFGMDFLKFYDFIEFIALKRLSAVRSNFIVQLFHGHTLGVNHAIFDLKAVRRVLEKFLGHGDVAELFDSHDKNPKQCLEQIEQFVEK